jgi:hypothetical protein
VLGTYDQAQGMGSMPRPAPVKALRLGSVVTLRADLLAAVRAHLSVPSAPELAARLLTGALTEDRLAVLVPVVLDEPDDPVAASIVREPAVEAAVTARAARRRLGGGPDWTLVLGGGLFADPAGRFLAVLRTAAPDLEEEFALTVADAPR